jgi:putative transposase
VLFVIDLESRRVHIAGVVRQPHGTWIQRVARNLVDNIDGFLKGKRYVLHDRDPLFTNAFRAVLRAAGVTCLKFSSKAASTRQAGARSALGDRPTAATPDA